MTLERKARQIGAFQVASSELWVSDPCYSKDTWCMTSLKPAQTGIWFAVEERLDQKDGWGTRVSRLGVFHASLYPEVSQDNFYFSPEKFFKLKWELMNGVVIGVDSGQAGFFDDITPFGTKDSKAEWGDMADWYNWSSRAHDSNMAAVIPGGALGCSGYGDGSYDLYVVERGGLYLAAYIDFMGEDDEEEDEDY